MDEGVCETAEDTERIESRDGERCSVRMRSLGRVVDTLRLVLRLCSSEGDNGCGCRDSVRETDGRDGEGEGVWVGDDIGMTGGRAIGSMLLGWRFSAAVVRLIGVDDGFDDGIHGANTL